MEGNFVYKPNPEIIIQFKEYVIKYISIYGKVYKDSYKMHIGNFLLTYYRSTEIVSVDFNSITRFSNLFSVYVGHMSSICFHAFKSEDMFEAFVKNVLPQIIVKIQNLPPEVKPKPTLCDIILMQLKKLKVNK